LVGLLGGSLFLQNQVSDVEQLSPITDQLKSELDEVKLSFDSFLRTPIAERIFKEQYAYEDVLMVTDLPFTLLVYKESKVVFWSNNDAQLGLTSVSRFKNGVHYIELKNGYYMLIKAQRLSIDNDILDVVGLFRLKSEYGAHQNAYLVNERNPLLEVNNNLDYATDYRVSSNYLEGVSTSLYAFIGSLTKWSSGEKWTFLLEIIFLLLGLLLSYSIAVFFAKQQRHWLGFLILILVCCLAKLLTVFLGIPLDLYQIYYFNAELFRPELIAPPGSIFLNVSLGFLLLSYFYFYIPIDLSLYRATWGERGLFLTMLLVFLFTVWTTTELIRNFILHSNYGISSINIFTLENTFILVAILLLIYGVFLVARKMVHIYGSTSLAFFDRLLMVAIAVGFFLLLNWLFTFDMITILVVVLVLLFGMFFPVFVEKEKNPLSIGYVLFWLFFLAVVSTILLGYLNNAKERKDMLALASSVILQEDVPTETALNSVAEKLLDSDIVSKFYTFPFLPQRELYDRIYRDFLGEEFNSYEVELYLFDHRGVSLRGFNTPTKSFFDNRIRNNGIRTSNEYVYAMANPSGFNSYLLKIPVFGHNKTNGFLMMELTEKVKQQNTVYPELVMQKTQAIPPSLENVGFVVYNKDEVETIEGKYPYPEKLEDDFKISKNHQFLTKDNFLHLVYTGNEDSMQAGRTAIISTKKDHVFNWVTLLSFFFVLYFFLFISYLIFNSIVNKGNQKMVNRLFFSSFRKRINTTMVFILFSSFFIIGLVAVIYFSNRSIQNQQEYLETKQSEIYESLAFEINKTSYDRQILNKAKTENLLRELARIHSLDINVFDLNGTLIASSVPQLYKNGVISTKMNPTAYYRFTKKFERKLLQPEVIGRLNYLASYTVIKNRQGNSIGYLNIPYFSRQQNLRSEITNFLLALLNAYVLILFGASLLTFWLSRSLTGSLDLISEKLKQISLGKKNERLEWKQNDEIGALVNQYNSTIDELENSVSKLAKAEREYAWQQMAKQIAHEIKNPLTPMKLSIQHLQRAIDRNDPNVRRLTVRVADTLIEQIDHLAHIATEFSAFAQMPQPQEENIEISEMLRGIVALYEGNANNVRIVSTIAEEETYVRTDRSQLTRVFHNLITNAMQAMQETSPAFLIIMLKVERKRVLISFQDNGKGIPEEKKEKVFYPNFTTKNSGMGLGLAISKNIILSADGQIWFDSEEDEGTTFYVELPQKFID